MGILNRTMNVFRSERVKQDIADELAFHVEEVTARNMRDGMTEEQARHSAQRQVGNATRLGEQAADVDFVESLDALRRDAVLALRTIRKVPLFAAITILSLTLGIGANTMVFTVMKHLLMDSLPVPNARRLVILHARGVQEGHTSDDGMASSFSYPQYQDLSSATRQVFSGILARLGARVTMEGKQTSELVTAELVSGNYFSVLGVKPWRGRLIGDSDNRTPGGHPVAVLGYGAWQRLFGSDPSIVNHTVRLNSHSYAVVGIAPPNFYGIRIDSPPDVYVPMMMKAEMTPTWDGLHDRLDHWARLIGSLQPGVTATQAQNALAVIYPPIRDLDLVSIKNPPEAFKREFSRNYIELTPGAQGYAAIRTQLETPLRFLAVMVAVVLLITIMNIANLLISRNLTRERDMAVRLSIGAGRAALVRQLLVESVLLATAGGALGVMLAYIATPVLLRMLSRDLSDSSINGHPDVPVMLFMAAVTMISAIAFGLLPALQSAQTDPAIALRAESSSGHTGGKLWLRRILAGAQISFSMLLLTGALLFSKSLINLQHVDVGFATDNILTLKINPANAGYSQPRIQQLGEESLRRLRAIPDVRDAAVAVSPVLEDDEWGNSITVEGAAPNPAAPGEVLKNLVSAGYFDTFQLRLLSGRVFSEHDEQSKVAVVNETFVKDFLKGQNPLGRHIAFSGGNPKLDWTIVGVVADSEHRGLRDEIKPFVFTPYRTDNKLNTLTFYVRTGQTESAIMPQIRTTFHKLDPGLPLYDFRPLQQVITNSLFAQRGLAALANLFAGLAILLAAIGLYGVVSFSVNRRRREFGIRLAVGADPSQVLNAVLRETAIQGLVSLLCALPLVIGTGQMARSVLYGVEPTDPVLCSIAAAVLFAIAMLAGFFPARQAARIDPQIALRSS